MVVVKSEVGGIFFALTRTHGEIVRRVMWESKVKIGPMSEDSYIKLTEPSLQAQDLRSIKRISVPPQLAVFTTPVLVQF